MPENISLDMVFLQSPDVVAREIEGEMILVPIVSGIGGIEDTLYSLNESGKSIWRLLDGARTLKEIVTELSVEFSGDNKQIEQDVVGLISELYDRRMILKK
jgi:hypothetical protein